MIVFPPTPSMAPAPAVTPSTGQAAAQKAPSAPAAPLSYRVDSAGAVFTLPSGFVLRNRTAMDQQLQANKDTATTNQNNLQCTTVPFASLARTPQGTSSASLIRFSLSCSRTDINANSLGDFASGIAKGVAQSSRNQFFPPVRYRLASNEAVLLRGVLFDASGRSTEIFFACFLAKPDVFCWEATAPTPAQLHGLAAMAVRLDNGTQTTLVPEKIYAPVAAEPTTGGHP